MIFILCEPKSNKYVKECDDKIIEVLRNENKDFQFDNKRLKSGFIPCNNSG